MGEVKVTKEVTEGVTKQAITKEIIKEGTIKEAEVTAKSRGSQDEYF